MAINQCGSSDMMRAEVGKLHSHLEWPYPNELAIITRKCVAHSICKNFELLSSAIWLCFLFAGYPFQYMACCCADLFTHDI